MVSSYGGGLGFLPPGLGYPFILQRLQTKVRDIVFASADRPDPHSAESLYSHDPENLLHPIRWPPRGKLTDFGIGHVVSREILCQASGSSPGNPPKRSAGLLANPQARSSRSVGSAIATRNTERLARGRRGDGCAQRFRGIGHAGGITLCYAARRSCSCV